MSIEFSDYKHIVYSVDDFIELLKVNLSLMLRITSKTALYFEDLVHLKVEDMSYVMLIRSLYNTFKYFSSFIQQCKGRDELICIFLVFFLIFLVNITFCIYNLNKIMIG